MVNKAVSLRREKIGPVFGRIDNDTIRTVSRTLAAFLGLRTDLN